MIGRARQLSSIRLYEWPRAARARLVPPGPSSGLLLRAGRYADRLVAGLVRAFVQLGQHGDHGTARQACPGNDRVDEGENAGHSVLLEDSVFAAGRRHVRGFITRTAPRTILAGIGERARAQRDAGEP